MMRSKLARELLHATTRPITTTGYHYQLLATAGWKPHSTRRSPRESCAMTVPMAN
jgi:hypothetical protein